MKRSGTVLALVLFGLVGCQDPHNPTPTGKVLASERAKTPTPAPPAFAIDAKTYVEFKEGEEKKVVINGNVPSPGSPILSVSHLPTGAVYTEADRTITWKPDFNAGNDPKDPKVTHQTYPVTISLRSTTDAVTVLPKEIQFLVFDTPQKFEINVSHTSESLEEGTTFKRSIKIESLDLPNGPFIVDKGGLPPGATLTEDSHDPTIHNFEYTPPYNLVTVRERRKDFTINVVATSKARSNLRADAGITWTVTDKRMAPKISGPTRITQGLDVRFMVSAEDFNGEESPEFKLARSVPFGKVTLDKVLAPDGLVKQPAQNPTANVSVHWSDIPADQIGKSRDLELKACVYRYSGSKDLCENHTITVTFQQQTHTAPVIVRTDWKHGLIRYMKMNPGNDINLPVESSDGKLSKVEIFPEPMRKEVDWYRGTLKLRPRTVGQKQFSVVATTSFGVTQTESFFFEVVPTTWANHLLLGESTEAEVKATTTLLGTAQVVNPENFPLDDKIMAVRTLVFAGTSIFGTPTRLRELEDAAVKARNLMVATPLLGNGNDELKSEMASLGVKFKTRLTTVAGLSVGVDASSGLKAPSGVVSLAGTTTSESVGPLPLELTGTKCKALLTVSDSSTVETVAAQCDRQNGGHLFISGIEWADIAVTTPDQNLVKTWLGELETR